MASQIVDGRYALSEQASLPAAARGLPAWVAKIAIWVKVTERSPSTGPAPQRAQDSGRL